MRRLAFTLLALLTLGGPSFAQKTTALPNASTPLSGAELLDIVQGGINKKIPVATLFTVPGALTPPITIGTPAIDLSNFGTVGLTVAAPNAQSSILGFAYQGSPGNLGLPAGVNGYGYLAPGATGDIVFGGYWLATNNASAGSSVGGEITSRNNCGAPDIFLPPIGGPAGGVTGCTAQGLQITAGGTNNSSVGLQISSEGGSTKVFNTGEYIYEYAQYGLFIEAQPSGTQTGAVIKTNGNGAALQLLNAGTNDAPSLSILDIDGNSGGSVAYIRQNGDTYLRTLGFAGHGTAPTLLSCGTGPNLAAGGTDAKGTVGVGSGTTACTVTFGTTYAQVPACVISGENLIDISITGKSSSAFTVGGASLASATFDYVCMQ